MHGCNFFDLIEADAMTQKMGPRQRLVLFGRSLLLLASLSYVAFVDCDKPDGIAHHIVNGEPVSKTIDSAVSFFARPAGDDLNFTPDAICGATLIHSDIVVTAAHCQSAFFHGVKLYDSTTKIFSRQVRVDRVVRHPQWDYFGSDPVALNYDVMLMRLETPVSEDDPALQPILINANTSIPSVNDPLTVYGFGRTETGDISNELRHATVEYIDNQECTQRLQRPESNFSSVLPLEFMCTVGPTNSTLDVSTCSGDSGGPVTMTRSDNSTIEEILVGVIAAGIGCSTETVPNGHVRMSMVAEWMQQEICRISQVQPDNCTPEPAKPEGTVVVLLEFSFDFFPQETIYAIRSLANQTLVYTGPEIIVERNQQINTTIYLTPGQYAMEVYDTFGNGMMGRAGTPADPTNGRWQLFALHQNDSDRILLAMGDGNFTRKQVTTFEVVDATEEVSLETDANREFLSVNSLTMDECLLLKGDQSVHSQDKINATLCECLPIGQNQSSRYRLVCEEMSDTEICADEYGDCEAAQDCCETLQCLNGFCLSTSGTSRLKDDFRIGGRNREQGGRSQSGGVRRRVAAAVLA
jgi:Trypsin